VEESIELSKQFPLRKLDTFNLLRADQSPRRAGVKYTACSTNPMGKINKQSETGNDLLECFLLFAYKCRPELNATNQITCLFVGFNQKWVGFDKYN